MANMKKPKGLKVFGAGDPNYVKDMIERGRKSGKTVKVPNPNGDKMMSVGAKPKITTKPAPKKPASVTKPKVTAKPKSLNDYLDKGKTPPSRNKKLPSDADVILKGYNDKKTIAKLKARKNK
jgi:hypothetical protein